MAEEAGKPESLGSPKKKKGLPMTAILIGGITLLQAGGFYAAFKMFGGGPQVAHGEESASDEHVVEGADPHEETSTVELELLSKFRVPNEKGGKLFLYDFDIFVKVPAHKQEDVETIITERKGEISDRIARIVRRSDRTVLHEAELKTLRMQILDALSEISGEKDLVLEVLIPRCVPFRSD